MIKYICACGCNGITSGKWNSHSHDYSKFIHNHHMKGKHHSLKTRKIISELHKGIKNKMWKGNKVGRVALHAWIKRYKQKPKLCEKCNKRKPYDLANISNKYKRDINDYKWLCRKCHMLQDGRMFNLKQFKNIKEEEDENETIK